MIFGTGTDMVSISRIERLIDKYGKRFLGKIFTEHELEESVNRRDRAQFFAARFAAREAFFKALGTGWGRGISLKEVSVVRSGLGKPDFALSGRASRVLEEQGITGTHLSITHDGDYALAFVIMEGGP